MRFHHVQIDPDKHSSVLTEFEPGISHGGPNSPHVDVCLHCFCTFVVTNLTFWPRNIAHLGSHHLAEQNEAAHTPLDPPRRVSMFPFSLSQFCNRRNSFLKNMFGKPAPRRLLGSGSLSGNLESGSLEAGSLQSWATDFGSGNPLT